MVFFDEVPDFAFIVVRQLPIELAGYLSFRNFSQPDPDLIRQVEQMLEQIRTLAPDSADYLIAQSYYTYYILKDYEKAYRLISQAQILRPSDARIYDLKSWIQRRLGDFDGKIESQIVQIGI